MIKLIATDMDEAMKLGDRICVMNKGKVIQLDTPENIRNNPNNKFIKEFFEI